MVQLLSMVLDFLDALSGAVAIAYWWCTWVRPAKQDRPPPSAGAEIDRFLHQAQLSGEARQRAAPPAAVRAPPAAADVQPAAAVPRDAMPPL